MASFSLSLRRKTFTSLNLLPNVVFAAANILSTGLSSVTLLLLLAMACLPSPLLARFALLLGHFQLQGSRDRLIDVPLRDREHRHRRSLARVEAMQVLQAHA